MSLAKLAIKQPIFITMILLAVTLIGVLSYFNMGVDLYPDMSNPVVSVSVSFPGAGPQDVETLITKPLERTLSSVNGVSSISSNSREGSAMVMVIFNVGYDIQQGSQEVRERLDTFRRNLPTGANDPILRRFDPNQSPFMTMALDFKGSNISQADLRRVVEEVIQPRLERLEGVAAADVSGLSIQQVEIDLIASKLKALKVSPSQVVSAIQVANAIIPAGRITGSTTEFPLRTSAELRNLDEMSQLVVARKGSRDVLLNEVADIGVNYPTRQTLVRINGNQTLVMSLQKQSGSNVVKTAFLVKNELSNLARDIPGLNFTIIQDDSAFIEESDRDVTITLIIGALLTAFIVFIFIRNIRNTLITVAGLPFIVMATFGAIALLGFTRNIITLMSLSLSIGLLIDDAIVVRENIFRHMEKGETPRVAAEKGTNEIAFAVLAITLTIVAVFIPVAFTSGQIGRLFNQFGITVAVAVLISLFEALTFAPLLSAYFAKQIKSAGEINIKTASRGLSTKFANIWQSTLNGYKHILAWSLRHRLIVVGSSFALFAISVWIITTLPMSFFPATDSGQLTIGITLPTGTILEKTNQVANDVERVIMKQPEVVRIYSRIGQSGSPHQGSISLLLEKGTVTDDVIKRLRDSLIQYGRNLSFSKPNQFFGVGGGGPGGGTMVRGRPVAIAVKGPVSLDVLDKAADQIIERLDTISGIRDAAKSLPPQEPELHIIMDRQRLANTGISATLVGQQIRTLIQGTTATQVDWQNQRLDVNVQLRDEDRSDPAMIADLPISGNSGDLYPLSSIANIEQGTGPTVLERLDRQSQIAVGANLEGRTQGEVIPDVRKALSNLSLPAGVIWQFTGQQAQTQDAFSSLILALILGLVFVYMVLASQFGSFIHPFTVMIAIPLAIIGSAFAMIATHVEVTVISMIGIILLMGLATKNSILLVDFIIRNRRQGLGRSEAVLSAGPIRLRPILMTTMAIILGMIPTALGLGASGAFRAPMAIAIIGGQVTATLLSLITVPVVYTLIDDSMIGLSHLIHRNKVAVNLTPVDADVTGAPENKTPDSPDNRNDRAS